MIENHQTNEIRSFMIEQHFSDQALLDDLVDHISSEVEVLMETQCLTFNQALEIAKGKILPEDPLQIENDLKILTTQTPYIMIKKTAYIGGYLSAFLFSLAILFTILSFQNESLVDSRRESMTEQYLTVNLGKDLSKEETNGFYENYYSQTSQLKLKAISQSSTSQMLLIISILLFGLTYLPYRFYQGYKRSELRYS
ncbi:hypothetical protein [Roseivirga misakiensis]|uniref:Uncharacterized protein n=1 Tax=Roseivirga misakiensis TaxID=1563681 RepID=A0A1E5T4K3_9BACT|nr:hypothetical protein [Roseivirga misakiensis]OEK06308.1 hypothetical protein BFP71_01125 [Roseivirga misakiensis]